jgi:beta-glucosidase
MALYTTTRVKKMSIASHVTGSLRALACATALMTAHGVAFAHPDADIGTDVPTAAGTGTDASQNADTAQAQAAALVGILTPAEKLPQLLNVAPAIPRLNIPRYNWWTESLHGAIGRVPTTNFPEPIGLAATFDAPLLQEVASTISAEVRALHAEARRTQRYGRIGTGLDTWSPNINIFRDPRWGRGQETYGEDPFLTARLGVAFVTGMQGPDPEHPDVIASPKHFAVHSGPEPTRHRVDVRVSPHDLEDTYLPAFRAAIVEGRAGSIMCAYNSVNGQPACANDMLLKQHLRGAWGFKGYVVSDCDAVMDISDNHHFTPDGASGVAAAIKAGVDNECNTSTLWDIAGIDRRYADALGRGLLTEADIDTALTRLFAARFRNGDLPIDTTVAIRKGSYAAILSPANRALALKAAEEAVVLLKNDDRLPLAGNARLLVIGPLADATRVLRGNYSSSLSGAPVSVLEGLREAMPNSSISQLAAPPSPTDGDPVPTSAFLTPDGKPGIQADYYNATAPAPTLTSFDEMKLAVAAMRYREKPALTRVETGISAWGTSYQELGDHRVVFTGFLVPPASGTYRIAITGDNGSLELDGKLLSRIEDFSFMPADYKTVELIGGHRYPIRIVSTARATGNIQLLWKHVDATSIERLPAAATAADVIIAVVGLTSDLEGEEMKVNLPGFKGGDRTSLDLPADQQRLLEAAAATGKPVIVVLMNGSAVNLTWAKEHASAIVDAWYPGQSGGLAVARILSGETNPSGRLPLTFYRDVSELPAFDDYSMANRTYRYFPGKPVYPFGYGLSYTRFAYTPLAVKNTSGGAVQVTTHLRNTGTRAGDEVAQLYLSFPEVPGVPRIALRGFKRVSLQPGEEQTVTFDLSPRDLSSVDVNGVRRVAGGRYQVSVGSGQPDTGVPVQSAGFTMRASPPLPL